MYSKEDFPFSQKHKHHCKLCCTWCLGKGDSCGGLFGCLFFLNVGYQKHFFEKQHKNHQVPGFPFFALAGDSSVAYWQKQCLRMIRQNSSHICDKIILFGPSVKAIVVIYIVREGLEQKKSQCYIFGLASPV